MNVKSKEQNEQTDKIVSQTQRTDGWRLEGQVVGVRVTEGDDGVRKH